MTDPPRNGIKIMNKKKIVRDGYNRIASAYLKSRFRDSPDVSLLKDLSDRLPEGAFVLDAGCGAGIPITEILAGRFYVIGLDFSGTQLKLARRNVPNTNYLCGDLTVPVFRDCTFDAVCSYYAIIHVPRELHINIFKDFYRILKPGGYALLCLGADDLENDIDDDYNGAPMYWSHFDAETNLRLLSKCGFKIAWSKLIGDATSPGAEHLFSLIRKPE